VRGIVETAGVTVREKNGDQLFQKFVRHAKDVDVGHVKKEVRVDKFKATDW